MFSQSPENSPTWLKFYSHAEGARHRYKLHICIHPDVFQQDLVKKLLDMLSEARAQNLISFKLFNVPKELKKGVTDRSGSRQLHSPFVIYLKNDLTDEEMNKIILLCKNIENVLSHIPPGDINNRALCDLPLTPHIIFRQAYLGSGEMKYINAIDAAEEELITLKKQGKSSKYYQVLTNSPTLDIEILKARFLYSGEQLINTLRNYHDELEEELERIKNKYGDKDTNFLIIAEQLARITEQMTSLRAIITNYVEAQFKDSRSAELAFSKSIEFLTRGVSAGIQFSEDEQKTLFSRRDSGKRRMFMELLGSKTDTESHVKEITDNAKKRMP